MESLERRKVYPLTVLYLLKEFPLRVIGLVSGDRRSRNCVAILQLFLCHDSK